MERVAVAVGQAGQRHAAQDLLIGSGLTRLSRPGAKRPSATSKLTPAWQPSGSHAYAAQYELTARPQRYQPTP